MAKLRILTVFALFLGLTGVAGAQNLQMDGMNASDASQRPTRGMTAASVEARFGAPQNKVAPVGDPPISRWEYANFVVFFEYDRVIHAVVKRRQTG